MALRCFQKNEILNYDGYKRRKRLSMDRENTIKQAIVTLATLTESIEKIIRGRRDTIDLVLTGLVSGGHVLIEDYPGSGKTTLAKTLGRLIASSPQSDVKSHILPFRRIQFTPDLLPSDVLGVNIFDPNTGTFRFQHGPIFAHVVLADEINRTGPKVQAAFLECMAERQVTIDNVTHSLDRFFFVIGTQNPLDLAGTYPLPLVQLDRFLLRIPMSYVGAETELEILKDSSQIEKSSSEVVPVVSREEVIIAQHATAMVHVDQSLLEVIVGLVQETRQSLDLQFGASTRAAIMLKNAVASWALIKGRDYATEDDLKFLAPFVLLHRLKFIPGSEQPKQIFEGILEKQIEKFTRNAWKGE